MLLFDEIHSTIEPAASSSSVPIFIEAPELLPEILPEIETPGTTSENEIFVFTDQQPGIKKALEQLDDTNILHADNQSELIAEEVLILHDNENDVEHAVDNANSSANANTTGFLLETNKVHTV